MASSQLEDSTQADSSQPQVLLDQYDALYSQFRWLVPGDFNIAQACCTRWAQEALKQNGNPKALQRVAIREHVAGQNAKESKTYTYLELHQAANRLSNLLTKLGVHPGDRVAIVLPQRFETAVAYMAVMQMGAVAMPLSILFGPEALQYRLQDSEAVLAICDEAAAASLHAVRASCPLLRKVLGVEITDTSVDFELNSALAGESIAYSAIKNRAKSKAGEGAILIYTSGTTGPPKGALIPHRALIGNLSGFVCSQNWFGFDGAKNEASNAVFWSPADWAWTGGLMDALLPTLYFGREIIAFRGRFSPEAAFELMQTQGVTHTFLFPTALKAMMKAYPEPQKHFELRLQSIMSAGEAVGDAVFDYCRDQLGVVVNEMFGQTEINYIVGNCSMNAAAPGRPKQGMAPSGGSAVHEVTSVGVRGWPAKPGSMGKPYPGHRVAVIDDDGNECAVGVSGDVAVNRFDIHGDPDPIFFLGYWKNETSTSSKFTGHWCRTGDLASRDADGYLWYQGRADDVFKAAGYRIGPSEIENCLVKHPAVVNAAVVPKPDAERGAVVKAYVVLAPDFIAARAVFISAIGQIDTVNLDKHDAQLISQLQLHVKNQLAPYEYPKEIEFIDALPMTTTGKIRRRVLRMVEEEREQMRQQAIQDAQDVVP
ncbi:MAG: AMP-binding protein [Burkholderiaceae bacterium]|nr:AMP-binding protein [Burkholderiaceae bacterium]